MFGQLLKWWRDPRRHLRKRARRELNDLFLARRDLLLSTSLRPEHRGRTQILDVEDEPLTVVFGIVRHPRPYAFSRQFHEVMEVWTYWPEEGRLERIRGHNLSRERGTDGDPPAWGG